MFNIALKKWKWVQVNPFADAGFPQFENARERWLTVAEEKLLLSVASPQWLSDLMILAIHTGCRRGEILSLTWKTAVDMDRRVITVQASKRGLKKAIPVSDKLYEILKKRKKVISITGKVFDVSVSALKDAFERAVEKAGIENLHFHDLRHTFATRLVQSGVDIYRVQKLLGHRSIKMTERYSHHYPESLRESIRALDECYKSVTVDSTGGCINA